MGKLVTTQEAAERLGVTRPRVHALIQAGRLPAEKMGRDYFIKESDLSLVAERKPGRPPKQADEQPTKAKAVKAAKRAGAKAAKKKGGAR
jgi:excisionase family DNA binding protein